MKRAPLSDLSSNIPAPTRQSTRRNGSSSAENTENVQPAAVKVLVEKVPLIVMPTDLVAKLDVGEVSVLTISIKGSAVKNSHELAPIRVSVGISESPKKRPKRVPKPAAPLNAVRATKAPSTLAMHVKKYGSTHDIEC